MRISDWSSDVCSSDLTFGKGFGGDLHRFDRAFGHSRPLERIGEVEPCADVAQIFQQRAALLGKADRKSVVSGKRVSVRVDLGGRRFIKKKNTNKPSMPLELSHIILTEQTQRSS